MQLNQNSNDNSEDKFSRNQKFNLSENDDNHNYLYPNGHRITHQMRWFKGSRDRCLRSDIAA